MLIFYIAIDNYWETNTSNQTKDPFQTLTVWKLSGNLVETKVLFCAMIPYGPWLLFLPNFLHLATVPQSSLVFHDPDTLKKY